MKQGTKKGQEFEKRVQDHPVFHNTWILLSKYRDVRWSLELSVQSLRNSFECEIGSSVDDYLESIYLAGVDFSGSVIESQAKSIEKSNRMMKLIDTSIDLLRNKHKFGEIYYWVLYYTYLSPQELGSVSEIIETLEPRLKSISYRTYYRYRNEAIEALGSVLWGYTSKDCLDLLEHFFPEEK